MPDHKAATPGDGHRETSVGVSITVVDREMCLRISVGGEIADVPMRAVGKLVDVINHFVPYTYEQVVGHTPVFFRATRPPKPAQK